MRKLNSLKLLLSALLLAIGCNVWGDVKTITGSSITGFGNGTAYSDGTFDAGNGITIASDGAFSTTQFRIAKSKTLTISISSGSISEIKFTVSSGYKLNANNLTYNNLVGTYSNASGVQSVSFSNSNANIARITKIEITYTSGGGSNPVDASWSVEPEIVTVMESKTATATITTNYDGTLSVESNAEGTATATISGKVITVTGVAEGTTTLTVTGAATSSYNAISKTISVTVTANARPAGEIFYESFDTNDGTGGNDDQWSGNIASSTIKSDNTGWTFANGKGANQCAKFGAGSSLGSATTPALGHVGNATLTFKAAAWDGNNENTTLKLSVENGGSISSATVTLVKGKWTGYTVNLTDLTAASQVKFEGYSTSNSRFFLDEVSIVATSYTLSVTSAGWASLCLPFAAEVPENATAFYAAAKSADAITLTSIEDGIIAANEGVLIRAAAGDYTFNIAEDAPATRTNLLKGVTADWTVEGTIYVLSGVENNAPYFQQYSGTTLDANKAYLPSSVVGAAGRIRFVVEESNVVTSIENNAAAANATKVMIDGAIYIVREGNTYDMVGNLVK